MKHSSQDIVDCTANGEVSAGNDHLICRKWGNGLSSFLRLSCIHLTSAISFADALTMKTYARCLLHDIIVDFPIKDTKLTRTETENTRHVMIMLSLRELHISPY